MATTKAKGTPVKNGTPVFKYKCGFPVEIILPRTNTDAEFYEGLETKCFHCDATLTAIEVDALGDRCSNCEIHFMELEQRAQQSKGY